MKKMIIFFVLIISLININAIDFIEPTDHIKIDNSSLINNIWNNNQTFTAEIMLYTADNTGRIACKKNDWEIYTEEIQRHHISIVFVKYFSVSNLIVRTVQSVPKNTKITLSVNYNNDLPQIKFDGTIIETQTINEPKGFATNNYSDLLIGNNGNFNNFDGLIEEIMIADVSLISNHENNEILTETDEQETAPESRLFQNYPNPFSAASGTSISFQSKIEQDCSVEVYNVKGQKVVTLFDGNTSPNKTTTLNWNGTDKNGSKISSGVYFYKLQTENETLINKMVIQK